MNGRICEILEGCGISIYGFCVLSDVGDLLPTRNRSALPENAATVISFLFPYRVPVEGERNLSLYAVGPDYHDIINKKLNLAKERLKSEFPQNEFAGFCDNSPIREVRAAYLGGLGFLGQNGLIIHPKFGSYCFIGEIVTDLKLERYSSPLGFCKGCGLCTEKCVGGALSKNENGDVSLLSREKCLSFLTQKKGELLSEQEEAIARGSLVWGCDGCSLVCPMNRDAEFSDIEEFYVSPLPYLTEETAKYAADRAYGYKGEKILLRNLSIINQKNGNNNGN